VRLLPGGDALVFGAGGLVLRLKPGGGHDEWAVPDREVTFLGAHIEESGVTTLVGERPAPAPSASNVTVKPGVTIGAIAQFQGDRVSLMSDAPSCVRLRGATRLHGGTYLACGDWGSLVRLELGVAAYMGPVCGGHLGAIAAVEDGGAVTVGVGGHALHVSPRFETRLEAVQTTRDLSALTIAEDGAAWAGAAQARVLRRTNGAWVRMSGDVGISPGVVAIWAVARLVRVACDDGSILEGRLS
jgi:hypothetical protein